MNFLLDLRIYFCYITFQPTLVTFIDNTQLIGKVWRSLICLLPFPEANKKEKPASS